MMIITRTQEKFFWCAARKAQGSPQGGNFGLPLLATAVRGKARPAQVKCYTQMFDIDFPCGKQKPLVTRSDGR